MKEIGEILRLYQRHRGEPLALATLVRTTGSSYRQPGARMLVTRSGGVAGSLSGGCLEEEIAQSAQETVRTARPIVRRFDMQARFGCRGTIDILVERVRDEFLADLGEAWRARRSCLAATVHAGQPDDGSRMVADPDGLPEETFIQCIEPAIRLLLVGHGPDSEALESFGRTMGWKVEVIGSAWEIEDALDERTAVVIGTHHYGRDFAALRTMAKSRPAYIGLIGSRRRREELLGDLFDVGVQFNGNLFGPAGLDLGAEAPEQIALAIVSEIQAVLHGGTCQHLRSRAMPIHAHPARISSRWEAAIPAP
jgi:xanthine dehydrogenase accessory factor